MNPLVDGDKQALVIRPPGLAAHDEREFLKWLEAISWKLIHANLSSVDLVPMISEHAEILVRTIPLDRFTFERVRAALV